MTPQQKMLADSRFGTQQGYVAPLSTGSSVRPPWIAPRILPPTTGPPFPSNLPISSTYWLLRAAPRCLLMAELEVSVCPHFKDGSRG